MKREITAANIVAGEECFAGLNLTATTHQVSKHQIMIAMGRMKHQPVERVLELTDKVVDERIPETEWSELQALLTNSAEGRRTYVEVMLLQSGLYHQFNVSRQKHHS